MAAFTFKLGGLDLSGYLRVNPDDRLDPQGAPWIEPAFTDTPFADGQPLLSTTVHNREQIWPLFLKDPTGLKDQLHALIAQINNAASQRPLLLEWRDSGASSSTFYDVQFVRFEPDFNYRRSVHGYGAGVLHVWTSGYGHTGTTRVAGTAAGSGILLSVPIASIGGDAPALLTAAISAGSAVPSSQFGRIVALAPIAHPSYTPRIPAASLLDDLMVGASLQAKANADGSQMLSFPGGGVLCKVPLPNPTIAGGDNRILAVGQTATVTASGVAISALDPYGNVMAGTAIATTTGGWSLLDLGVCRLPTVGYPTRPKISILAGSGLWLNEVLCLPDKNLTMIVEATSLTVKSFDIYTVDGAGADSYRVASNGDFAGVKLVGVQRGAFPKLVPSTSSVAVLIAPLDKGSASDTLSAVISVRERFTYGI